MIKHYAILYFATLSIMTVLDIVWLKGIAHEFYKNRLGDLLEFRALPAVVFYVMYVAAILIFVSVTGTSWKNVLMYGAFFGFTAYATYDLTNMATIRNWPLSLTVVDIAWGTFNTGVSATAGWLVARYFASAN